MVRELLDVRIEKNGDSLKIFEKGVYIGSFSIRKLLVVVKRIKEIE